MRRKLVKQGAATMMISLPSKWIKENGLGKGSEVEVEERRGELVIGSSAKEGIKKQRSIEITDKNIDDIRTILTHTYRKGYDKITLRGKVGGITKYLSTIVSEVLLGFEITRRSNGEVVIENVSQPDETKYDVMLSKVFLLIEDMSGLIENDEGMNMQELEQTKNQCDKFVLFCRRILIDRKGQDQMLEWEFLTFLTHIQHRYYYLLEYIVKNKMHIKPKFLELFKESKNYFHLLENAYLKKEISFIHDINRLKTKYQFGDCLSLIVKSSGKDAVIYSDLREIFRLIQIASSPILAEILDG